jgi:uncharacterized OsmC-like protein
LAKLDPFLTRKTQVLADRRADYAQDPAKAQIVVKAHSWVGGITGTRPTRMGEYTVICDSAPGLGGNSLGPTSPEMLLGALASCLIHTYLIQACLLEIPLDHAEVEVQAVLDMAGVVGAPGSEPPLLRNITFRPRVTSAASPDVIEHMHQAVEASCPVLNTLRAPVTVARA